MQDAKRTATLVARNNTLSGILIPSWRATLRSTGITVCTGRSIGRSPGFAPLSILATYSAARGG